MFCEMKKLKNGVEIPVLALGTWFIDDDKAADAVKFTFGTDRVLPEEGYRDGSIFPGCPR